MEISSEGKDILDNIDEVLASEYECFEMLMSFDNGDGPKSAAVPDIIKVIKKTEDLLNGFIRELSIYDTTELLEGVLSINDGCQYGISYGVPKEKMIITRTMNELLSKYLMEQVKDGNISYSLILNNYLTIDLINMLIAVLNKMYGKFSQDIQQQIIIVKYQLLFSMREVGEVSLNNDFKTITNPLMIYNTISGLCQISQEKVDEYTRNWIRGMYYNALREIINSNADELSIIDIVSSAMLRALILLADEEFASDLMHVGMDQIRYSNIPNFNEELIFEAITSRFEDEEIPQFLSFGK